MVAMGRASRLPVRVTYLSDRRRSFVHMVMVARRIGRAAVLVALIILGLPASGQSRLPPQDDGSTYTWPGATMLTVDVQPWGGG